MTTSETAKARTIDQRLIALRDQDVPWAEVAKELGYTVQALKVRARRIRERGDWTINGREARGAPTVNGRGRPRNVVPKVPVSPRFAPEVGAAVRQVAEDAGGLLVGDVVAEAMKRALARRRRRGKNKELDSPFNLDPGKPFKLCNGHRTETLACNVEQPIFEAFSAAFVDEDTPVSTAIAEAVHQLLMDLNYRLVDCEDP